MQARFLGFWRDTGPGLTDRSTLRDLLPTSTCLGLQVQKNRGSPGIEGRGAALEGYFGIGAEIEWRTGFDPDPELADPLMTLEAPSGQRPQVCLRGSSR